MLTNKNLACILKGDCVLHGYNRGVDGKHHHNPFP
jgi:hypothetical protein